MPSGSTQTLKFILAEVPDC